MAARSLEARIFDITEAIEHIRSETTGVTRDSFEADWHKRWLVERGVEIVSEAIPVYVCPYVRNYDLSLVEPILVR